MSRVEVETMRMEKEKKKESRHHDYTPCVGTSKKKKKTGKKINRHKKYVSKVQAYVGDP